MISRRHPTRATWRVFRAGYSVRHSNSQTVLVDALGRLSAGACKSPGYGQSGPDNRPWECRRIWQEVVERPESGLSRSCCRSTVLCTPPFSYLQASRLLPHLVPRRSNVAYAFRVPRAPLAPPESATTSSPTRPRVTGMPTGTTGLSVHSADHLGAGAMRDSAQ